jgi:hypothetical protein
MIACWLTRTAHALALLSAVALAACGGGAASNSPTAPSPSTSTSTAAPLDAGSAQVTPADLPTMLTTTLQDEYHAQQVYQGVLNDFGAIRPFVNIVSAEARHAQAISQLFATRGLDVPPSAWTAASVPHFTTVQAACAAAATAEVENIALYDRYLALDLPADVRTVFTNNRAASATAHLPAFNACR